MASTLSAKSIPLARPKNGVGAFVFQCRKLVFSYCEHFGSNNGMVCVSFHSVRVFRFKDRNENSPVLWLSFVSDLVKFAKKNPQIEIVVQHRPAHHPIVKGFYREIFVPRPTDLHRLNGRDKVICVRNLSPSEIGDKVKLLRDSSGAKTKLLAKKPVLSTTESVRGIWSPFHSRRHKI
ncbi:mitochondrial ribosomal protein L43 [Jimgerdemannia flammicorona]|uniref:Large ribosomal subunit protein mL43 n=1 Tax=Jimgerdemannia flammicorona TaxID=994334 RepID=A0A433DE29_9FUNG|nr:mitochondrial ribosomal protein L43 [Jimgerdemannia flammicorona]